MRVAIAPVVLTVAFALLAAGCDGREGAPAGDGPPETAAVPAPAAPASDAEIIAAQAPHYTVLFCVECGRELDEYAVDIVEQGKLVRLCDVACVPKFRSDVAAGLEARDEALIATQLADYPTDQCVVMEADLDVMGTPKDIVWGSRLVRLCCDACIETFHEDPATYLAMIDAAKQAPPSLGAAKPAEPAASAGG